MNSRHQSPDVLRGMAVLLVIVDHYALVNKSNNPIFDAFGRGVDLFFVLSGFLISGLLFSEYKLTRNIDLKCFWIRRGLKIYPAFYAFILVTTILAFPDRMPARVFLTETLFFRVTFATSGSTLGHWRSKSTFMSHCQSYSCFSSVYRGIARIHSVLCL